MSKQCGWKGVCFCGKPLCLGCCGATILSLFQFDTSRPMFPSCLSFYFSVYNHRESVLSLWYNIHFSCSTLYSPSFSRISLTPSLQRPYIHAIFVRPPVRQRVNTHSVFWEFCWKPCQHAARGCDKRWMTCIHAGVSRSPREHASVPPDKRHCRQWMSSLFCGFLPNPFIHDLFCPLSLMPLRNAVCSTRCGLIIGRCFGTCNGTSCAEERRPQ